VWYGLLLIRPPIRPRFNFFFEKPHTWKTATVAQESPRLVNVEGAQRPMHQVI
jgi:hypothetical protein